MKDRDLLSWEWPAEYPDSGEPDSPATWPVAYSSEQAQKFKTYTKKAITKGRNSYVWASRISRQLYMLTVLLNGQWLFLYLWSQYARYECISHSCVESIHICTEPSWQSVLPNLMTSLFVIPRNYCAYVFALFGIPWGVEGIFWSHIVCDSRSCH